MSSLLAGAWELVSDAQSGIAVFTDTHYNITITAKDRQPFKGDEPTDAEAAEAYRALSTAAGTYEISGTTLILHRTVNRNPSWTGKDAHWEISIDGDRLTADNLEWKRVG